MNVLAAINKGAEFLERKGVDSPRLQSELLLAHLFELPRLRLYLNFERVLTEEQSNQFRELLVKRGTRIPLQHLIGSTSFCGFLIKVSNAVLTPRPETESLAELAWVYLMDVEDRMGSAEKVNVEIHSALQSAPSFLDLGTGSGCLSIALAQKVKAARGVAIDISLEALEIARANVTRNGLADRIELRTGDFLAALQPAERFDVIVSNPPYIPSREIDLLQPEVRDHDPRLALDGGADGLDFYRALAERAAQFLQPGGRLMVEFGDGQGEALRDLFGKAGWHVHGIERDLSGCERILVASTGCVAPVTN